MIVVGAAIEPGPEVPDAVGQAGFGFESYGIFRSVAGQPMATLRCVRQGPDATQDVIEALGSRSPCPLITAVHLRNRRNRGGDGLRMKTRHGHDSFVSTAQWKLTAALDAGVSLTS